MTDAVELYFNMVYILTTLQDSHYKCFRYIPLGIASLILY